MYLVRSAVGCSLAPFVGSSANISRAPFWFLWLAGAPTRSSHFTGEKQGDSAGEHHTRLTFCLQLPRRVVRFPCFASNLLQGSHLEVKNYGCHTHPFPQSSPHSPCCRTMRKSLAGMTAGRGRGGARIFVRQNEEGVITSRQIFILRFQLSYFSILLLSSLSFTRSRYIIRYLDMESNYCLDRKETSNII